MNNNYIVIKKEELKDIASKGTLLKHVKSGAKVVLLENDDNNKMFCIGFRTPPYDDTGVPHIIEHSVLCGSEKYPVKEPFVELMKGSLNTFLNAMTFSDKTIYPVASCNDKDFQNLIDVYMDAVLKPNILVNKKIFMQEGWHYELTNKDDEIIYNGVVYNEMKGAFSSADSILYRLSFNSLFPDTPYGTESGGDPKAIPSLTYENFVNFYKKYYHPSNSYIIIYGDCNMEEKLEYLDKEYLSKYDEINPESEIDVQKPFDKIRVVESSYQLPDGQSMENKALMSYNIALPKGTNQLECYALDIINTVLLDSNGAILERALLDKGLGEVISGNFDSGLMQPTFFIKSKNIDENKKVEFIQTIEESLKDIVKNGLNKKALEAALNNYEFKLREADYGGMTKGLIYTYNIFATWLYDENDPFSPLQITEIFDKLRESINTSYYESLITKYFIENNHKSLVVVKPGLDVNSKEEARVKDVLAKYKASLSEDEINKIIEETKELKEYQASNDTKEGLATIPVLTKDDLTLDVPKTSNIEKESNGVKVIHHDFDGNGIAYTNVYFNLHVLKENELYLAGILRVLLSKLDTEKRKFIDLDQDININTGGLRNVINIYGGTKENTRTQFFTLSGSSLVNKVDYLLDLINEIIYQTNFDMKDKVKELLQSSAQERSQFFVNGGNSAVAMRCQSYFTEMFSVNDKTVGIDYYNELMNILNDYDNKYDELINNLKNVCAKLFVKDNAIVGITCNEKEYEEISNSIDKFTNNLKEGKSEYVLKLNLVKKNEGFKAPFNVNYNALCGDFTKANLTFNGSIDVASIIINTEYLWKQVRVLGGAYGCYLFIAVNGCVTFSSYRDPKIEETYDVYKNVIEFLNNLDLSEDELFKFVIGAVGEFDYPSTPSISGVKSMARYFNGTTEELLLKFKTELINTTLQDVKNIAKYLECVIDQNYICTIGNKDKVETSSKMFNKVDNLLK